MPAAYPPINGIQRGSSAAEYGGHALDMSPLYSYLGSMDAVPIKPERKAQLDDYVQRYGQNVTDPLDEALAAYLEWERTDYREAVEGIRRGHEDVRAGRTRPAAEFLAEMRRKYGLPG